MTKKCCKCGETKPVEAFNKKGKGYNGRCKQCQSEFWKAWYSDPDNRRRHIEQSRFHADIRKKQIADEINKLKSEPCVDCHRSYKPYVMQYDHINGDKELEISHMVSNGHTLANILAEIAKCELVCANCHAERTHNRADSR